MLDRCKVSQYKVILYRAKNELRTSLAIGLGALEELGIQLSEPERRNLEHFARFYALVDQDTQRTFRSSRPYRRERKAGCVFPLLSEAMNGAFFVGSRLLFTISMKMVEITVKDGNSPHAAVAYIYQAAFTLAGWVCDFEECAPRLGKLALRLNEERYHVKPYEAIILNNWGGFISHHTEDVPTARHYTWSEVYYIALENGMYYWTGYCAINHMYMSFLGAGCAARCSPERSIRHCRGCSDSIRTWRITFPPSRPGYRQPSVNRTRRLERAFGFDMAGCGGCGTTVFASAKTI